MNNSELKKESALQSSTKLTSVWSGLVSYDVESIWDQKSTKKYNDRWMHSILIE